MAYTLFSAKSRSSRWISTGSKQDEGRPHWTRLETSQSCLSVIVVDRHASVVLYTKISNHSIPFLSSHHHHCDSVSTEWRLPSNKVTKFWPDIFWWQNGVQVPTISPWHLFLHRFTASKECSSWGCKRLELPILLLLCSFQFKVNTEMENCELWIVQLEIVKLLADYGYTQIPVPITWNL